MSQIVAGNLPRAPVATRAARDLLEPLARRAPEPTARALRLLVTELVANCVVHGGNHGDIELEARMDSERRLIRAQVTGAAGATSPHIRPSQARGAGGYGLRLVEALSARWGVHEIGGRIRVWFDLPLTTVADASREPDQRRVDRRHHEQRRDEDDGEDGTFAYRHVQVLAIPA